MAQQTTNAQTIQIGGDIKYWDATTANDVARHGAPREKNMEHLVEKL
jgi:hypothetical protein